jgi:argininosuccinate lyase
VLRDRFRTPLDSRAQALLSSVREDAVLLPYDLWGSIAHARMLGATGLIGRRTARRIESGLRHIGADAAKGRFPLDPELEDVHLNVESALTKRIGEDGARLHTARSRNDQVALDIALYLRDALLALEEGCDEVAGALLRSARGPDGKTVVNGWTHLQPAQAVYWSQLLGSHALRFARDATRFRDLLEHLEESPLGAGALAGSSLGIDRALTARLLGFRRPSSSSIHSVSDRDALAEAVFGCALATVHASAWAEEIVLGSMEGVERVRLSDAFVTTSSLMPHKRNPDLAELIRAEAGPAIGRATSVLSVLKGLPIGYQRDLQATKPILVESVERTLGVLGVLGAMTESASYRPDPARRGRSTASVELADALVATGMPFRLAHQRVARYVAGRERAGGTLSDGTNDGFRTAFPELEGRGFTLPTLQEEPERRTSHGGSSRNEVARLLREVERLVMGSKRSIQFERRRVQRCRAELGIPIGWPFVDGGAAKVTSPRVLRGEAGSRRRRRSAPPRGSVRRAAPRSVDVKNAPGP